jgi:hypothetical protein
MVKQQNEYILGFSITKWLADHNFTSMSTLPVYGQLELQEDLGLAQYLQDRQCSETDDIYSGQTNGWRKGDISRKNYTIKIIQRKSALFLALTECFFLNMKIVLCRRNCLYLALFKMPLFSNRTCCPLSVVKTNPVPCILALVKFIFRCCGNKPRAIF